MSKVEVLGSLVGAGLMAAACCVIPGTCPPDGGQGPSEPAWQVVAEGEEVNGALLSAWGDRADNVLFVGGALGNGRESMVLRWDGARVTDLHPGGTETYWWVHGADASTVFMVGEQGRVTRFDGANFTELSRPTAARLWGVHVFSATDVFVVGGTPNAGTGAPNDLVYRWDGNAWTQEVLPGTPRGASLFKVWGTGPDDLFVVGEGGTLWHRGASGWVDQSGPMSAPVAQGTVFTVHGCSPTDVYAVGTGNFLHYDGTTWSPVGQAVRGANGVSCRDGAVTVVGFGALKLRGQGGTWTDDAMEEPLADLHAVFTDESGVRWAVGGDWLSPARNGAARDGMLARFGPGTVTAGITR